jgi:NarL family two-component system sensor histidine kinase LiaS
MIRMRHSRLISLSVFVAVAMLVSVALLTLTGATRLGAVSLCFSFATVYALVNRAATTPRRVATYFAAQALVTTALLALSGARDSFNFLFYVLSIQAMLVLPTRAAGGLITTCYLASALLTLGSRGLEGTISLIFNAAVFFFTGAFGYILRQAETARWEKERLLDELRASQRQVRELAIVEERNRLARDLHDSAKQRAFALSAQLDAVNSLIRRDPTMAEAHLQRAIQVADHLRQELANLILQLRPPEMDQGGLPAALRRYAAEWSQQCSVAVDVHVAGERPLPAEVEQALFRIAQEALANVARHSQAGSAQVLLDYARDRVSLTIADTGCGFDPAEGRPGVGTRSMRERAARLPNGQFRLDSGPGQGTRVTAQCSA